MASAGCSNAERLSQQAHLDVMARRAGTSSIETPSRERKTPLSAPEAQAKRKERGVVSQAVGLEGELTSVRR